MKIISDPKEMQALMLSLSGTRGFVPTMGALHEGHGDLIKRAVAENPNAIVSIFVNPTQFNDPKDLTNYPRTWDEDVEKLKAWGATHLFAPNFESLYPDNYNYIVSEKELSPRFCGADRPGHFNGVLSVVMKLLQIVQPHQAYFGEKDFQQLSLIQGMVDAFFIPTRIVPVPTRREKDGLAMSSRNKRLSPDERIKAAGFNQILSGSSSASEARGRLEEEGFAVDYVEDWGQRRLAAIRLGAVRLIDNVKI